jgi:hypothetical protein
MARPEPLSTAEAVRKVIEAPPPLRRLLTPLLARTIARKLAGEHPGSDAAVLVQRLRSDLADSDAAGSDELVAAVERNLEVAARHTDDRRRSRLPSALVLVIANLVPLYGVLLLDWPVFPLILLFWIENVVIGLFNVLRMLTIDPRDLLLWVAKIFLGAFFCLHYGAFTAVHGSFVFGLFDREQGPGIAGPGGLFPVSAWLDRIDALGLWLPAAALTVSHLFSYLWNFLGRGEYRIASLAELMHQPYRRVIVLHVTLIAGGIAVAAFDSPLWALLLLLGFKVALDLRAHLAEHRLG